MLNECSKSIKLFWHFPPNYVYKLYSINLITMGNSVGMASVSRCRAGCALTSSVIEWYTSRGTSVVGYCKIRCVLLLTHNDYRESFSKLWATKLGVNEDLQFKNFQRTWCGQFKYCRPAVLILGLGVNYLEMSQVMASWVGILLGAFCCIGGVCGLSQDHPTGLTRLLEEDDYFTVGVSFTRGTGSTSELFPSWSSLNGTEDLIANLEQDDAVTGEENKI